MTSVQDTTSGQFLNTVQQVCDNMPDMDGPHHLNFLHQPIATLSSFGSSHHRWRGLHKFYKYTTDITYITESRRKKDKQARTWVSPKRKKGEVLALFWHSVFHRLSRACTRTKVPHSYQERWLILLHWLIWLLDSQVPTPRFNSRLPSERRLSLTVDNSYPLTALRPCFSLSSSSLVGDNARKPFAWVSRQNRQRSPLAGAHPHAQKECPPSWHRFEIRDFLFQDQILNLNLQNNYPIAGGRIVRCISFPIPLTIYIYKGGDRIQGLAEVFLFNSYSNMKHRAQLLFPR